MSTLTLQKGQNLALDKVGLGGNAPIFLIGLGWDPAVSPGVEFDLDAQAIIVDANEKALDIPMLDGKLAPVPAASKSFIFYNQRGDAAGAVALSEDDRSGGKVGDDETIKIDCGKLPANAEKVVFTASIHEAAKRGQNFGQVKKAYIRILDAATQAELLRYDLSEDASVEAAMVFGELYRKDGAWKFRAVGNGTPGGLAKVAQTYGVDLG